MAYLDKTGLTYFWSKIKAQLSNKSDKGHTHSAGEVSGLHTCATSGNAETIDGKHIIVAGSKPTENDSSVITVVI